MRYPVGLVCVLAGLVALPLSASAQPAEEDSLSSWQVDEGASLEQPAPEEPALKLRVDDAGVEVVPSPPRTVDGYTLEETQLRVKRARIGLLSSAAAFLVGIPFLVAAGNRGAHSMTVMGVTLYAGGAVGMIASGIMLGKRNRELDRFEPAWPVDSDTLEEMQVRVKRAAIGLGVSAGSMVLGTALAIAAGAQTLFCFEPCSYPGWVDPVFPMAMTLAVGGAAGMVVSGILLGKRKRKLRRLQEAHYATPRRVQWDLARSRLVF
jgi:hypothetical protein